MGFRRPRRCGRCRRRRSGGWVGSCRRRHLAHTRRAAVPSHKCSIGLQKRAGGGCGKQRTNVVATGKAKMLAQMRPALKCFEAFAAFPKPEAAASRLKCNLPAARFCAPEAGECRGVSCRSALRAVPGDGIPAVALSPLPATFSGDLRQHVALGGQGVGLLAQAGQCIALSSTEQALP
jgi:hypothetical protein